MHSDRGWGCRSCGRQGRLGFQNQLRKEKSEETFSIAGLCLICRREKEKLKTQDMGGFKQQEAVVPLLAGRFPFVESFVDLNEFPSLSRISGFGVSPSLFDSLARP